VLCQLASVVVGSRDLERPVVSGAQASLRDAVSGRVRARSRVGLVVVVEKRASSPSRATPSPVECVPSLSRHTATLFPRLALGVLRVTAS
jgi:hypothetical protein